MTKAVWVYINGQPAVAEAGAFHGFAILPDGMGRIKIHAEDQAGNIAYYYIEEITVIPRRRFPLPSRSTRRAGPTTPSRC